MTWFVTLAGLAVLSSVCVAACRMLTKLQAASLLKGVFTIRSVLKSVLISHLNPFGSSFLTCAQMSPDTCICTSVTADLIEDKFVLHNWHVEHARVYIWVSACCCHFVL